MTNHLPPDQPVQPTVGPGDTAAAGSGDAPSPAPPSPPPTSIGPYTILRPLGKGGMGEVYLAEQHQPLRRLVALKIIKRGMDTREIVGRFEAERQALALMNHPNIAKVLDAGETDDGLPFFVMEYVDGVPFDEYCDRERLPIRARLELFLQVCAGVQHAHQKAVIHRDLKPTNILVAEVDGDPVPKIIDFGIARATEQHLAEATAFTQFGQIIGTPAYMSPEQADPVGDDIDTRTDIYSLGVVLYKVLIGVLPFEDKELLAAGFAGIIKLIREKDAPRPSAKLRELGETTTRAAAARGVDAPRLQRSLVGDLDWIVLKTLEKDRNRRYETANALAMDLRRHLAQEPVLARPPSASYRLGKLVRRNRGAFAAAAAITAILIGATFVSTVQYVRADRASRLATLEANKSAQVAAFLGDMLQGVEPSVARGRDTAMLREILDNTSARIGEELADAPEVEAELRHRLGTTYVKLGDPDAGDEQLRRALELQQTHHLESPDRATLLQTAAMGMQGAGRPFEADSLLALADRELTGRISPPDARLAQLLLDRGIVLNDLDRYQEADSLLTAAQAMFLDLGGHTEQVATCLNTRANTARYLGQFDLAEDLYRQALARHREALGEDHPFVATDLHNLGGVLAYLGRAEEAEQTLDEALALQDRVLGPDHPDRAITLTTLARFLQQKGAFARADSLLNEALAVRRIAYGERSSLVAHTLEVMGDLRFARGESEQAEDIYREVLDIRREALGEVHTETASAHFRLGRSLMDQRRNEDALPSMKAAVEITVEVEGEDSFNGLLMRNEYARLLNRLEQRDEALTQLREVLAKREQLLGPNHPETAITRVDLGLTLRALKDPVGLAEAEDLMRQGSDDYEAAKGADNPGVWNARTQLFYVIYDRGRFADAEALAREILAARTEILGPDHVNTRLTGALLATALLRQGRPTEAEAEYAHCLEEGAGGGLPPADRARLVRAWASGWRDHGDPARAEQILQPEAEALLVELGAAHPATEATVEDLVEVCEAAGRPDEAARWRQRVGG